jgi:hypothetical protein
MLCPQLCMGILPRRYTETGLLMDVHNHDVSNTSSTAAVTPTDRLVVCPLEKGDGQVNEHHVCALGSMNDNNGPIS